MSCPHPAPRRHLHGRLTHRHVPGSVARALLAVAAVLALAAPAVPALAQDELPRLREPVTDLADALTPADEQQVAEALTTLLDDDGVQLFVLFVDSTGVEQAPAFTKATAEANSLGGNDALVMVAVEDRSDAMWVADGLPQITDGEIDRILTGTLEPGLRAGDFAAAIVSTAETTGRAATGDLLATAVPATPAATAVPGGSTSSSRGFDITPILAVLLLVGGALLVGRAFLTSRARARAGAAERDRLSREANTALLAGDEALKDADEEVGFAEAQWGEEEAAPFRAAIAKAREELRAAFSIRQRLDDAEPESAEQREAMLREILQRTATAKAALDAETKRLAALRDLERTAPEQLAALPSATDALRPRLDAAKSTLARLAAAYAPAATASVNGNLAEADKALAAAVAETTRGRGLPDARRSEAVVALRHAQEGVASATRLVEGVERLAASLDDAAARVPQEIAAAEQDLEAARHALGSGAPAPPPSPGTATPAPADALAEAERQLAQARTAAAIPMDPLSAIEHATAANRAADAILAGVQAAEAAQRRRFQVAQTSIASARGRVDQAVAYITTRRHGVGQQARTRAAEAEAKLDEAVRLADDNPEAATAAAQRAQQLADEAYRLAAGEFDQWDAGRGPVAGPYGGGASPGAQVLGSILGGIIGGVIAGGGRGSGWGGSPWGGSGGRTRGGGFGLPSGPFGGGFGGGGGGGGRVRGGRW